MSSRFTRLLLAGAMIGGVGLAVSTVADAKPSKLPVVSVADASAVEDAGSIEFEITLEGPVLRSVNVFYSTQPGTAHAGSDYESTVGRVKIRAGETSATVSVPLYADMVAEPDEEFTLHIYGAGANESDPVAVGTIIDDSLTVNLVHINDHHSHLDADDDDTDLGGAVAEFDYDFGGFPRVAAKIKDLESTLDNVVKIHAGDAITGTLYYTLFKGEADAAMMNDVCFDMFALGNHEFDDSDAGLAQFLDWLAAGDCDTPVLAANVVPQVGTPLAPVAVDDYIQPYVVKDFGTEKVGFIGLDIAQKTQVSSSPLATTQFLDEATTAQYYVDELAAMGVDNIVLVTHYQYQQDVALASQVSGIDAIVGGDSHTLLGDFGSWGITGDGPYPTHTTNADGDPVCVVQAWQYASVVGELNMTFDEGKVVGCDGTPHLLVDNFTRTRVEGTGDDEVEITEPVTDADLDAIMAIVDTIPSVSVVTPDPVSAGILAGYSDQVEVLTQQVIGTAGEPLCLGRIPGDTRGAPLCAPDQVAASGAVSNVNGGFIQQIVTDAFRARAFRADFALQNAGGVRINIPPGEITIADAYTLLPFANTLVELEMTGAQVETVLEEAVANFLDSGGSTGSYPYGSDIRWDVDLSQGPGSRFSNVEVYDGATSTWGPIDPSATYIVATNSFLAGGRDGWFTFGTVPNVDTFIDYAQGFIDWVEQDMGGGPIMVPAPEEFSTQSFVPAP